MKLKQTTLDFDFPEAEVDPVHKNVTPEVTVVAEPQAEPIEVNLPKSAPVSMEVAPAKKSNRGRLRLDVSSESLGPVNVPDDEELFSKSYYSMGVVAEMFNVNHSLLRFWENEFDVLKPKKNPKGNRLFRPEDVKNIKLIYHLLRERKYTIEGAKEYLKSSKLAEKKFEVIESLKDLKAFLNGIKASL